MHICHITTVHSATDTRIFYRMCRSLAAKGLRVTLIARDKAVGDSLVRLSFWNGSLAKAGRVFRVVRALQAAVSENADVYHFHDPELILVGLALKVLRPSAAVVYDVHEDYPAMMLVKHWLPQALKPVIARAMHIANTIAGLCLDGIVTADPGVQNDFSYVAHDRTLVFYNFPTLSLFSQEPANLPADMVDLIYIGGMSERAGTFILLDALALLAQQGLRPSVRLGGYTDGEAGRLVIQEGIRRRDLGNQVDLVGRIPQAHVPTWLRGGRIGLVPLQPIAKFLKNIPSKMFEYWACGLPVIASDLPPIRRFVSDGENGLLFDPSSPQGLARAIQQLMERPNEAEAMGRNGQQQFYEHWNNDYQVNRLIHFYEQISRF